jgi:arsenite methyltransferase
VTGRSSEGVREEVRSRYAEAARAVLDPRPGVTGLCAETSAGGSCCGGPAADSCCGTGSAALGPAAGFGGPLYDERETDGLPEEAVLASLGCGNPLAVADLQEGEKVLDLGSGGGIDVLLSARRVGPSGFAYGVDMTDEMLALARANAAKAGAINVEFRKGEIEALPLPDAAVDVVISNCVISLSTDKPAVLAEMFRVLAPGGRIGISDVVAEDHLTAADRAAAGSYVGCIAGVLSRAEYLGGLAAAGFADASVTFTHQVAPAMHSAIIRAAKPATTSCIADFQDEGAEEEGAGGPQGHDAETLPRGERQALHPGRGLGVQAGGHGADLLQVPGQRTGIRARG